MRKTRIEKPKNQTDHRALLDAKRKNKRIIAVAFSDIHFNDWPEFSNGNHNRLKHSVDILEEISKAALYLDCPVLFSGDWGHTPNYWQNYTIYQVLTYYQKCFERTGINFYGISGNHDLSERNSVNHRSPSLLDAFATTFKTFNKIDFSYQRIGDLIICGIPYLHNNEDFRALCKEFAKMDGANKILLVHADFPGISDPSGYAMDEVTNMPITYYEMFKPFKLVLSGHIHKPQKICSNGYMLGATHQQRRSDAGCEMGYWLIDENFKMIFIPITSAPEFRYYEEGTEKPDDFHFYTMIPKQELETEESRKLLSFSKSINPIKLGLNYCKERGIKDKDKIQTLKDLLK